MAPVPPNINRAEAVCFRLADQPTGSGGTNPLLSRLVPHMDNVLGSNNIHTAMKRIWLPWQTAAATQPDEPAGSQVRSGPVHVPSGYCQPDTFIRVCPYKERPISMFPAASAILPMLQKIINRNKEKSSQTLLIPDSLRTEWGGV